MKLATFIDISYLKQRDIDWQIDIRKLASLSQRLAEKVAKNGTEHSVTSCRNIVVGSIPENVCSSDEFIIDRLKTFFNIVRSFPCFEVNLIPIDYHGYRIRKEDRQASTNPYERNFIPVEKGVDTTLVVRMMELVHRDHTVDIACVVSGDKDMFPAIKSIINSGCHAFVIGADVGHSVSPVFVEENIPVMDLCDYRNEVERVFEIDTDTKEEIDDLYNEVDDCVPEIANWSKDYLLAKLNIWSSKARMLNEKLDNNPDVLRSLFGLLGSISRDHQPGFVPALKKSYQGRWEEIIKANEEKLKELVSLAY